MLQVEQEAWAEWVVWEAWASRNGIRLQNYKTSEEKSSEVFAIQIKNFPRMWYAGKRKNGFGRG